MKYIALPAQAKGVERQVSFYLAMEEHLARHLTDYAPDEDFFFLWQTRPSVIFGRHQDIEAEVDTDYCRREGIGMYRRKSGGGCVYADEGNLMVSYVTRHEQVGLTFQRFIAMLVLVLRRLGIEAVASSRNDIMVGGRKVSGTAFYHLPGASIVHGTMLYDTTMDHMLQAITPPQAKLSRHGVQSVRQRIGLLKDHTTLTLGELKAHVRATLATGGELTLGDDALRHIERLELSDYLRSDFIFGRQKEQITETTT